MLVNSWARKTNVGTTITLSVAYNFKCLTITLCSSYWCSAWVQFSFLMVTKSVNSTVQFNRRVQIESVQSYTYQQCKRAPGDILV